MNDTLTAGCIIDIDDSRDNPRYIQETLIYGIILDIQGRLGTPTIENWTLCLKGKTNLRPIFEIYHSTYSTSNLYFTPEKLCHRFFHLLLVIIFSRHASWN
jgi:hypothetical protein